MERSNEECEDCELLLNREKQKNQTEILVFPNPVESWLAFEIFEIKKNVFQLDIYDDMGLLMETLSNIKERRLKFDMQDYAPGGYVFNLSDTKCQQRYFGKFILK